MCLLKNEECCWLQMYKVWKKWKLPFIIEVSLKIALHVLVVVVETLDNKGNTIAKKKKSNKYLQIYK